MPANYAEIVEDINQCLGLLTNDTPGNVVGLRSKLAQLITSARVNAPTAGNASALQQLGREAGFAQQDLFNLLTLVERIDWMRAGAVGGSVPERLFDRFATADIDMFHVEFRSIFDYIAQAMGGLANTTLPSSFNKLRTRLGEPGYADRIGTEIAAAVNDCNWFGYLKDSRDDLVHRGDRTLVFPHDTRILFQTFSENGIRVEFPPVMFNQNIADFEIYAGMWLGRLYSYLERWSERMFHLSALHAVGDPVLCSPGVGVMVRWMRLSRDAFQTWPPVR